MKHAAWPATKARLVLAALLRTGWRLKRQRGSHRLLAKPGREDYTFAYHDRAELGAARWSCLERKLDYAPRIFNPLCRKRNRDLTGKRLAVLQSIRNHSQSQSLSGRESLFSCPTIDRDTGKRWNIGDPTSVVLARKLDLQIESVGLLHDF